MFSKGFFVFGLLALFACQGATALTHQEIDRIVLTEVDRLSLGDLIDKVKDVLAGLEQLVGGVISDALGTLASLTNTLKEIKDKYLQGGIDAITGTVGSVVEFIKNATEKATELGVDISECVAGQEVGLEKLTDKLVGELTSCVTKTVDSVVTSVNNDIKIVQQMVGNVTAIPAKLSKCLITLKPIACVTDLLKDVTGLLTTIPQQVLAIVSEANALVAALPTDLLGCVNGIVATAATETTNIIADIAVCVEDKMTATDAPAGLRTQRLSLGELVDQIKQIIASLNELVTGVIADALKTLGNLVSTITTIKDKFLNEGLAAITGGIGNVVDFIKNKTQEAAELGVDIAKCVVGRDEQLKQLSSGLVANLTDCVTTTVGSVLTMVNKDIKVINEIVGNVTKIPLQLSKCLISLRPITCVTNLLKDATTMLKNLPGQIKAIIKGATDLVAALPDQLLGCVKNIATSTTDQTTAIISDIGSCVDELIAGATTEATTGKPTDPTQAPTDPTQAPTDPTQAPTDPTTAATRASLGELIDQVKDAIESLNKLVTGVIGDALGTLGNLVQTVLAIKEKFLDEGVSIITGGIKDVVDFIKNVTETAADLGIDITKCIAGRTEQLEQLGTGLTANLTDCVTTTVGSVLTMVNNDIKIINQIVSNVTSIPLKLSKCLISLKPITCVTNLLGDVTTMLTNLPGQIIDIVKEATGLVEALPAQLLGCVTNIAASTASQTTAIIADIASCVDDIMAGNTTTVASF